MTHNVFNLRTSKQPHILLVNFTVTLAVHDSFHTVNVFRVQTTYHW